MKSLTYSTTSLFIMIFFALFCSSAFAEQQKSTEIYKWVDGEGRVHYAARPGNDKAKKMHLGSKIFHNTKDGSKNKADNQKGKAERDRLCQESKKTLARYKTAPFLYRFDEELGKKVRLSEEETKNSFLQAEKEISYWCNPPNNNKDKE